MTWPETFTRRFGLVMAIYQPSLFVASLLVGWAKGLSLADTMLYVWVWSFLIGFVVCLMQSVTGRPGTSIWKSTVFH